MIAIQRWRTMAHDHSPAATAAALDAAAAQCERAGETLTPLRRRVLELLIVRHAPTKAYDLLADLGGADGPAKPPTVYRALEFLMRIGLAHKIESLNAFIACDIGACSRAKIFMICDTCGDAVEIAAGHADEDLQQAAAVRGFQIRQAIFEASGLCARCKEAA
jgi:Fur family zinc uptake transcriptional regulator